MKHKLFSIVGGKIYSFHWRLFFNIFFSLEALIASFCAIYTHLKNELFEFFILILFCVINYEYKKENSFVENK